MIYNYVSKSSPISPLPFRRKKEHTSFRIINVSFFQSPGKRVNHRVTEIRRRRMPPPPVRSTSFQVSPLPSSKKGTEGREFFLPGSLSSFFRRRSGNLYHHPLRIYTRTHTHIFILTHEGSNVSLYRKEARLFCDFTESTEEEAAEEKGRFDLYPRGLPPFQTDLFPSRLRERAEMQRILFLTIQTASRPRRPT